MHDLLTDEIIGVRMRGGARQMTLPGLLAALSCGSVEGYVSIQPHQSDPWHAFLVQLAATILARAPTKRLPTDPEYWRDGLLKLADGKETAWSLVEDVNKPAFLQYPWNSGDEDKYKTELKSPDELDALVASKNHEIKKRSVYPASVDDWVYAIVLCQTTAAFGGSGVWAASRMNGQSGGRLFVSWVRALDPSTRFQDEAIELQRLHQDRVKRYGFKQGGVVLTWLKAWDLESPQYRIDELDPWFIEAARAIRLLPAQEDGMRALRASTGKPQIDVGPWKRGNFGDPWIPLEKDKEGNRKAIKIKREGFGTELLKNIVFCDSQLHVTEMQKPRRSDGPGWLIASGLAYNRARTDGFHRAEVLVPKEAVNLLERPADRDMLAKLAKRMLSDSAKARNALRDALKEFVTNGKSERRTGRSVAKWIRSVLTEFDAFWRAEYFPALWREAGNRDARVPKSWLDMLAKHTDRLLVNAVKSAPLAHGLARMAAVRASMALRRGLIKGGIIAIQRGQAERG